MTEESSTVSHLSVAMTTTGMTQITGENAVASPSSPDAKFYFYCALVVIGVVGTATNALILYALVASKQHRKHLLIVNQNVLDVFTSFFTVISYSLRLCNIHLTGSTGYWLCALLLLYKYLSVPRRGPIPSDKLFKFCQPECSRRFHEFLNVYKLFTPDLQHSPDWCHGLLAVRPATERLPHLVWKSRVGHQPGKRHCRALSESGTFGLESEEPAQLDDTLGSRILVGRIFHIQRSPHVPNDHRNGRSMLRLRHLGE